VWHSSEFITNYVALLWVEVGQPSFTHSRKAWRYLNTSRNIYDL